MELFNDVDYWFNYEQGKAVLNKRKPTISVAMYKLLQVLVNNIQYRNVIIMNVETLSNTLHVDKRNLMTTINKLDKSFIRWESSKSNMNKGQFKILINPSYGFKYPINSLNYARERAVRQWLT